ncbi:hypothetical protein MKW98_003767 [Papaver atlanticum]|uniref:Peptide N-acetyl-beta-D-glucosaminyl asparaginase amidase A N-terminal domain-containing protein n=1 Tax=Papaver atlanticum TaxID=357466 RepID=A0AAD4T7Q9_9MAGN|nr:hypothetical protein MKW98_003767 [Papaver atlanticum]
MHGCFFFCCCFFRPLFTHQFSLFSHANLHRTNPLFSSSQLENNINPAITTIFQVTKPIKLLGAIIKNNKKSNKQKLLILSSFIMEAIPCASLQLLQHDFSNTYGQPPASVNYTPPSNCSSKGSSRIVLEWKSTVKGTQFDRIFGIWLSGVEIFRSCTAEPTASGIIWTVEKDITRYTSLLMKPQTLSVYLGNLVNSKYTGVYHVNLTFHFYPLDHESPSTVDNLADLIIPISRNLPLNDALWFVVGSSTDIKSKRFTIPQNSYRAVLEVYVSFHVNDEFWYQNPPNENAPFREVVVRLDGDEIGAVWPFTVVFTGGFNPLLWSFDLPSYDIEITPFLGKILDGKQHEFGFGVTNALNDWYIDANLHIWLDNESAGTTSGELIRNENSPTKISLVSEKKDSHITRATRLISSSGWVKSSPGNITTNSFQNFSFTNVMTLIGSSRTVNQTIDASSRVDAIIVPSSSSSYINAIERYQNFPFYLRYYPFRYGNYILLSYYVSLGFNEKPLVGSSLSPRVSSMVLNNSQQGQFGVNANWNLLASTQQVYLLDGSDGCYFWNVSSSDNIILYNISGDPCQQN